MHVAAKVSMAQAAASSRCVDGMRRITSGSTSGGLPESAGHVLVDVLTGIDVRVGVRARLVRVGLDEALGVWGGARPRALLGLLGPLAGDREQHEDARRLDAE